MVVSKLFDARNLKLYMYILMKNYLIKKDIEYNVIFLLKIYATYFYISIIILMLEI